MVRALKDVKWDEFTITNILGNSINSKAWHSKDLEFNNFDNNIGIPYITRTSLNNGLYGLVVPNSKYVLNPANSISLGAENAQYFVQPFRFITGNKMYYYHRDNLSLEALKFIVVCLNKSLKDAGFGFGLGLTGTRSNNRKLMLPITKTGEPDYKFMEEYIKEREAKLKEQYKNHVKARAEMLAKKMEMKPEWTEFLISKIFEIKAGKRLTKTNMKSGKIPFIGSSDSCNGITNFVSNENSSTDKNILGVNYNGSVVENFYHSYKCTFSDDVKRFSTIETKGNKYIYLFLKNAILKQKCKYMYGYKFNESRMKKQKIMLPIDSKGEPDYTYMENYMKYLEQKKLLEYLDYINK